jgi:hypothetical protein
MALGNAPREWWIQDRGWLPEAGEDRTYVVTAEVSGYVSEPPSYTTRVEEPAVSVVEVGQATAIDPLHLGFQFRPTNGSIPTHERDGMCQFRACFCSGLAISGAILQSLTHARRDL